MKIQENHSLKYLNTFHVDCTAKRFVQIDQLEDIRALIYDGGIKNVDVVILGGGSNMLFTKDFDGLVLHPQFKGLKVIEEDETMVKVRVGAGEKWDDFVEYTVNQVWGGIENLALIPGLVGAAPIQNIGAYGVELKDVFNSLRAINMETGELVYFSKEDCDFAYRNSIFKKTLGGKYLIYDVCLNLSKRPKPNIKYHVLIDYFKKIPECEISQRTVFKAIVDIRSSKLPDPEKMGNAGSFFKNPIISEERFQKLKLGFPEIVGYLQDDGNVKLAAAWLIEESGLKGVRKGNVGVHKEQALVIVNYGDATGKEIFDFSEEIRLSVRNMFGLTLEREVNIL